MGASYELSATVREKVGKGAARSVRRQGLVPAVIYGGKQPPIAINLPDRDVYFKIHGGGFFTTLATIDVAGEKIRAIPRDYQLDPISDRPLHVDFLRVIPGSPKSTRLESRCPGADVNPYIALAACVGAGLWGIEKKLKLKDAPLAGDAAKAAKIPRLPRNLMQATENLKRSKAARELFGDTFVDHFVHTREWEWRQFQDAVTDWELKRYFEII